MDWRKWWPFNIGKKRRAERDKYWDEVIKIRERYADALMAIGNRPVGELSIVELVNILDIWILCSRLENQSPEIPLFQARVLEVLLKTHPTWQTGPDAKS